MKVQATATLRKLRMSPRKVRMVVDLIRKKKLQEAKHTLHFVQRAAAIPVKKLLESAVANAMHNHQMSEESIVVKEAYVDGGPTMYRWMPRAFGRASKIRKRTSHITLILEGDVQEASKKEPVQKEEEKTLETPEAKVEKKAKKVTTKKNKDK